MPSSQEAFVLVFLLEPAKATHLIQLIIREETSLKPSLSDLFFSFLIPSLLFYWSRQFAI